MWINTINKTDSSVSLDRIYIIEHSFSFSAKCTVQERGDGKHYTRFTCDTFGSAICTYLTNFLTAEILYKIVHYMIFKERLCNVIERFSEICNSDCYSVNLWE